MSDQARVLIEELGLEVTVRPVAKEAPAPPPEQAYDRMALVSRLAGGIAHEMNNVLTAIAGYNELILSRMSESNPLRRDALEIEKAVERAGDLMRQLLAVAQRQVDVTSVFGLDAFVKRLEPRLRRIAGPGVGLVVDAQAGSAAVRASADQLEEAVVLLVESACKAMGAKGSLRIETALATIEEGDEPGLAPGSYARVSVGDSGPPVDEAIREQIFEPFVAAPGSARGAGLELATVFGLTAQNGGVVTVDGEATEGTTFAILLPALDPEAVPVTPPPGRRDRRGTVLLADDEAIVRGVVRETLERFGYSVLEAADGPEALELAERHQGSIDLLLTDVRMPRMNGVELAGRLRATRPSLRVLFMSGLADADVASELQQRPEVHYVDKPMTPSVLLQRVGEALGTDDTKLAADV
jgi:CheY-like chemotaxis protein